MKIPGAKRPEFSSLAGGSGRLPCGFRFADRGSAFLATDFHRLATKLDLDAVLIDFAVAGCTGFLAHCLRLLLVVVSTIIKDHSERLRRCQIL
jgi:hypothetical protein